MKTVSPGKYFYIFLSILTLCSYGFFVYAVAPSGGYIPGANSPDGTLDPACAPGDGDCFVNTGWTLDPTSNYVYNTTDTIGIGESAPLFNLEITGSGSGSVGQVISNNDTTGSEIFGMSETGGSGTVNFYIQRRNSNDVTVALRNGVEIMNAENAYLSFGTNSQERMRILAGGNVGIGTTAPTATFNAKGSDDLVGTSLVLLENNSGTDLFTLRNSGTIESVSTHTGLVAATNKALNSFTASILPDVSVDNSEYYGVQSVVTYDPSSSGLDLAYSGTASTIEANSNVSSGFFLTTLAGTGDVAKSKGISTHVLVTGSGAYTDITGISTGIYSTGPSTVTNLKGSLIQILPITGNFTTSYGQTISLDGDATNSGTKRITDGTGVEIKIRNATNNASGIIMWANAGIDKPGIEAVTNAYGIRIDGAGAATASAISGAFAYGIYMSPGSISGGVGNEYALYIDDSEAENYFNNGVRIGGNVAANKFDSATNGASSTVMYIGNSTIDVTAPSDERTKTDIEETSFGLEDLNKINVVDFKYDQEIIDDDNKQHSGVLAQQVQPIYPEAVTERTDEYLMVDYKTFIPLIIKSIQDLDLKLELIDEQAITIATNEGFLEQLRNWFADATNGIVKLFAGEVETKKLCVADDAGEKTCITKSQLDEILSEQNITPEPSPEPVIESETVDEPESVVDPEIAAPEEEVTPTPEPEPAPDPVIESGPDPETENV